MAWLSILVGALFLVGMVLIAWTAKTSAAWPRAGGGALGSQVVAVGLALCILGSALSIVNGYLALTEGGQHADR